MSICKHCNKDIPQLNKPNNYMANHSRWCEDNPKRKEYMDKLKITRSKRIGVKAWNKGLTKETNEILKKQADNLRNKYISGELINPNKGKIKTDSEKEIDRQAALKSNHQRVCKKTVEYICLDGSIVKLDSSWEVRLAKLLDENSIKWVRPKPLPWIDKKGIKHNYFPDFYLLEYNVFLDPKNDYAIEVQRDKLKALSEQYDNIIIMKEKDINIDFILKLSKLCI